MPRCKTQDVFKKYQLVIARRTLELSSIGVHIIGGMTKEEAKEILKKEGE